MPKKKQQILHKEFKLDAEAYIHLGANGKPLLVEIDVMDMHLAQVRFDVRGYTVLNVRGNSAFFDLAADMLEGIGYDVESIRAELMKY